MKLTKEERRVKKYVDAWCEGKMVQYWHYQLKVWLDEDDILGVLYTLYCRHKIRIMPGKRGGAK